MSLRTRYNTYKLRKHVTISNLQKELTNKINEIEELSISNKDLMKKNTSLRKQIKNLKNDLKEK